MSVTFNRKSVLALAAAASLGAALVTTAMAQESPFSNASLRGTYAVNQIVAGPNEPIPNLGRLTLEYFDGEGNVRAVFVIVNRQQLDEDGNPVLDDNGNIVREVVRSAGDQTGWNVFTATYEVSPYATFVWTTAGGSEFDGIITETQVIDGVLIATKAVLIAQSGLGLTGGGLHAWEISRIADGDWVPPAPAE